MRVGAKVGECVNCVGSGEGWRVGRYELEGDTDGAKDGSTVGPGEGGKCTATAAVGCRDGITVGFRVGSGDESGESGSHEDAYIDTDENVTTAASGQLAVTAKRAGTSPSELLNVMMLLSDSAGTTNDSAEVVPLPASGSSAKVMSEAQVELTVTCRVHTCPNCHSGRACRSAS